MIALTTSQIQEIRQSNIKWASRLAEQFAMEFAQAVAFAQLHNTSSDSAPVALPPAPPAPAALQATPLTEQQIREGAERRLGQPYPYAVQAFSEGVRHREWWAQNVEGAAQ